jgi:hypothetical protein
LALFFYDINFFTIIAKNIIMARKSNDPNDNKVWFEVGVKLRNLKKLGKGRPDRGIKIIKEIVRSKDSELDKE